eukprot:m.176492 g.176492  ORF g.176492 m.176492 type:complete len:110 (+) comp53349_c0_seq14:545-874(+)
MGALEPLAPPGPDHRVASWPRASHPSSAPLSQHLAHESQTQDSSQVGKQGKCSICPPDLLDFLRLILSSCLAELRQDETANRKAHAHCECVCINDTVRIQGKCKTEFVA